MRFRINDIVYFDVPENYKRYFKETGMFHDHYKGKIVNIKEDLYIRTIYSDDTVGPIIPLKEVQDKYFLITENEYNSQFIIKNGYNWIRQLADYLFEVEYSTSAIDWDYANKYVRKKTKKPVVAPGCSAVYKNKKVGRDFDWFYNRTCTFVVHRPTDEENHLHGWIGVNSGISELTKDIVEGRNYKKELNLIPCMIKDGINDAGLFVENNVVPIPEVPTTGTNKDSKETRYMTMLVSDLLEHCANFEEVKARVNEVNIIGSFYIDFETHYLVCKDDKCMIIEFENNQPVFIENPPVNWIANFPVNSSSFDSTGKVDYDSVVPYGEGLERSDLIADMYADSEVEDIMSELKYSNAYQTTTDPFWYTEFVGNGLTVQDIKHHPEKLVGIKELAQSYFDKRIRDEDVTWHTTHRSIYDLENKTLNLKIQEREKEYKFNLD